MKVTNVIEQQIDIFPNDSKIIILNQKEPTDESLSVLFECLSFQQLQYYNLR